MTRWSCALVALALTSCALSPTPEQQGAQLMAQLKEASGGAKLNELSTFHSIGTHVRNGTIDGTYESWGDYRTMRYAITETFAGVTTAGGFDGTQGWSIGPDGKARTTAPSESSPGDKLNLYLNTQAYYWPDRFPAAFVYRGRENADGTSFDVVTVTPKGAQSFDLWLDPATHRIARLTGSNGRATFTGVVASYRQIDGVWIMSEALQTMQAGTMTQTETASVTTFSFEPVPPERFAPPRQ